MINWAAVITKEDIELDILSQTRNRIANKRYSVEVGGMDVAGLMISTDDRSKLLINGAAFEAMIDPNYVLKWKTEDGFVELNAEQVIFIARSIRAHVQTCFDRESELIADLNAGTFTEEMLNNGWP